jgi:hypothetical protein
MLLDKMLEHVNEMQSWLALPETKLLFIYVQERRAELVKNMLEETESNKMFKLSGEIAGMDKILRLPELIDNYLRTKTKNSVIRKER